MRGYSLNDMASMESPLGRVTLVTGKEEFLGERTVAATRDAVRRADPEAELSETQAAGLTLATFGELAAPSLFSSVRCVVVRALEELPDESVDGLLDYAAAPAEDGWKFHPTGRPLTRPFVDNPRRDTSQVGLGPGA